MLAEQPATDTLEGDLARLVSSIRAEPATRRAPAAAGAEHPPEPLGWIDGATAPLAPPARADEIRIDQSQRIPVASGSREDGGVRRKLVVAALAALIGVASIGTVGGYLFFRPGAAPSTAPIQIPGPPADMTKSSKGDPLPIQRTIARDADRPPPAKPPPAKPSHRPHAAAPTAVARTKPSPAAASPLPADYHPPAPQPPAAAFADSAAKPSAEMPLAPVPETRPTTIDGWMLRDVTDGTAVLEGPEGTFRVKRGDTVPGVGKILGILRWGNRPIVATSRGLISTP